MASQKASSQVSRVTSSWRVLDKQLSGGGTHCLVEWDEPGNPRNVVEKKRVKPLIDSDAGLQIGELCTVTIREGSKMASYTAKLLGIGCKRDMNVQLEAIEESNALSADEDEYDSNCEDNMSIQIPVQNTSEQKSANPPKKGRKRGRPPSSKAVKEKAVTAENARVTKQILEGLESPYVSSEKISSQIPEPPAVPADTVSSPQPPVEQLTPTRQSKGRRTTVHSPPPPALSPISPHIDQHSPQHHSSLLMQPRSMLRDVTNKSRQVDTVSSPQPPVEQLTPTRQSKGRRTTVHSPPVLSPPVLSPISPLVDMDSPQHHSSLLIQPRSMLRDVTKSRQDDDAITRVIKSQLDGVKMWLEMQLDMRFGEVYKKLDKLAHVQRQKNKVHLDMATPSGFGKAHIEVGGGDSFRECTSTAAVGGRALDCEHTIIINVTDNFEVMCGNPYNKNASIAIRLPSEAAVRLFRQIDSSTPSDPAKFALKMLSLFFSDDVLGRSNCTVAEGRELLDPTRLSAIKYHLNYKYPLGNKAEEDKRWQQIVVKNLNAKCRGCRKKVKSLAMEQQENTLVE